MDEASSNLDFTIERAIKKLTSETFKNSTVFIIAHKLESIFECDKIIVMEDGAIVEVGSPSSLANDKNSYFFRLKSLVV